MKTKKIISVFLIMILLVSSSLTIAFADSNTYSSNGYYSANNIDYHNFNRIRTGYNSNGRFAQGRTYASTDDNSNLTAGWAGANARIFNESGALISQSGYIYNTQNTYYVMAEIAEWNATGARYCQGTTKAWNGESYWTFSSFATPCLNDYTA